MLAKLIRRLPLWTVTALLTTLGVNDSARAQSPQLAHMVFFSLAEPSEANARKLVEGCQNYLNGHEGTVYFSVGVRGSEFTRDVNDKNFDVALHLVFKDKAAHDTYQDHPRHLEFIEKNKDLWSTVRVFDSYLIPLGAATAASPAR